MGSGNAQLAGEPGRLFTSSLRNATVVGILTVTFVLDVGVILKLQQSRVKNVTAKAGSPVPPAVVMGKGTSLNEFLTFGRVSQSTKNRTMGGILEASTHWKSRLRLGIELLALIAFIGVGRTVILSHALPPSSSSGETLTENSLQQGRCPFCGYQIPGIWE